MANVNRDIGLLHGLVATRIMRPSQMIGIRSGSNISQARESMKWGKKNYFK